MKQGDQSVKVIDFFQVVLFVIPVVSGHLAKSISGHSIFVIKKLPSIMFFLLSVVMRVTF